MKNRLESFEGEADKEFNKKIVESCEHSIRYLLDSRVRKIPRKTPDNETEREQNDKNDIYVNHKFLTEWISRKKIKLDEE